MQTALHILSLMAQISRELIGAEVVSTEFYRKERLAYIIAKADKKRLALGLDFHPVGYASYLIPASKIPIDTREKPWPFFEIDGFAIAGVNQLELDRIFELQLENGSTKRMVVFEAIGPNGNLWLLDENRQLQATLRKRSYDKGQTYQPPSAPARLDPTELTVEQLGQIMTDSTQPLIRVIERQVAGFNARMARDALERAGLEGAGTDSLTDESVGKLVKYMRDMAGRFAGDTVGYVHEVAGTYEAYPLKLTSADTPPQKYKTLSLAVMQAGRLRRDNTQAVDEQKLVRDAVGRSIKRLERRLKKIQSDLDEAADYDRFRIQAELLQVNFARLRRGMSEIVVADIYSDDQHEVTLQLDSALGPQGNVEAYFKRHRKARDGFDLMERRLEVSQAELESLRQIESALETDFESARQRYATEIDQLLPRRSGPARIGGPRLPYREYVLTTGLRIFVGRDGADNDRTTFDHARPYELWFHTQQCPGSHVVMKFPNKSFEPSRTEIQQTAAAAAFFSKAAKDSLVPVIYTERRYVRKPRKAKPGLVTVDREKSIMVEPAKPETRLQEDS